MTPRAWHLAAAVIASLATPLPGEEASPSALILPSGARVRLSTTNFSGLLEGLVVRNDAQSVTFLLKGGGEQVVPSSAITRLDLSVSRKRQTLKGTLIGIGIGAAIGFLAEVNPDECGTYSNNFCSRGEAVGTSALGGLMVGSLVGALIQTEQWTPVDVTGLKPRGAAGVPGSGPRLALNVRIRF